MKISGREISERQRPYLIAEMSGNHNQSLERALKIVDAAASSGADALKLQTYTPDTMTLDSENSDFIVDMENPLWGGRQLRALYQEAYTPWEWHKPIMDRALAHGMHCFSTPFDESSVDFLEGLNVPAYKIASFENIDLPLIKKVASTGKPIIISTGMASLAEIDEAVNAARSSGNSEIILLKCTSTYPASPENTNLRTIPSMRDAFGCCVGLSDHTMGIGVPVAAVAFGAVIIEKHFTLSRSDGGIDSAFSMEPNEFKEMRIETERAWKALGGIVFGGTKDEIKSKKFRRSIYVCQDVGKGDVFTFENIRIVRPGFGLPPKFFDLVIGKTANRNIEKGTALDWAFFS
jgi:pseudaminic acid synthase